MISLISDYNKADHPVMDALEKSSSLTKSLNKVANMPDLFKLLDISNRTDIAKKNLKQEAENINAGLEAVEEPKSKAG